MQYKLSSSSTEDGEITEEKFSYFKSHLQFYYYPLTTKFIGNNTVPHILNYKNDGICLKLKKELKNDYPFINLNILEDNKAFFNNKFCFISNLSSKERNFTLLDVKADYKEIEKIEQRPTGENNYENFYFKILKKEDNISINNNINKIFCLEDKVLHYLDNKNAFLSFKVLDGMNGTKLCRRYIFEDVYFTTASFYGLLDILQESLIKNYNSEEIRSYSSNDSMFYIYSSTTFKQNNEIIRIFGSVDVHKNSALIINKSGPALLRVQEKPNNNIHFISSLNLTEGDYVINDKKIYKFNKDGKKFSFIGLDYTDFTKNVFSFDS